MTVVVVSVAARLLVLLPLSVRFVLCAVASVVEVVLAVVPWRWANATASSASAAALQSPEVAVAGVEGSLLAPPPPHRRRPRPVHRNRRRGQWLGD